jgi:TonB family protein
MVARCSRRKKRIRQWVFRKMKMTHKILTAIFILIVVVFGAAQGRSQTNEPAQAVAAAPSPTPVPKIVTKDPDYLKLLNPPQGNTFLQMYSKSYRDRAAEIQAKVGGISDENLQNQARNEEWVAAHKIDGDKFTYEAETALRDAKISFSQKHRDGWFEVGRVTYDENNIVLSVIPNSTTPIDAALRVPVKIATLNQVYAKFREIAAQEIDQKAHEYVAKAGAGSNCSRNPDWCFKYAKEDIEQKLRSERIVVVAQGDIESMRIDSLLLVDYDTEAVLLELGAPIQGFGSAMWRFAIGPVPAMPVEPLSAESQPTPATSASTESGPSPSQNAQGGKSESIGESASGEATASKTPATRAIVPGNVTAATIVTQTKPEYPPQAMASHIQGEVVLHAIIDKEGKISEVQVLSGDDLLGKSALEAVRQWRYKPMLVDGEPKEVDTTITVTFSLQE